MPMADWIDKYPQVKALLQAESDALDYAPDLGMDGPWPIQRVFDAAPCPPWTPERHWWRSPAREAPSDSADAVEDTEAWLGPPPRVERFYPPRDLSPRLPLTWAMVHAVWPRLRYDRPSHWVSVRLARRCRKDIFT